MRALGPIHPGLESLLILVEPTLNHVQKMAAVDPPGEATFLGQGLGPPGHIHPVFKDRRRLVDILEFDKNPPIRVFAPKTSGNDQDVFLATALHLAVDLDHALSDNRLHLFCVGERRYDNSEPDLPLDPMSLGVGDRKIGVTDVPGEREGLEPQFGQLGQLDDVKGPLSVVLPGEVKVEDKLNLEMGGDAADDSLHDLGQGCFKTKVVFLDELLDRDQVVLDPQESDLVEIGEADMKLLHRLQFFPLEVFISGHVQRIKILLAGSDLQEIERDRVEDGGHGDDRKIIQDGGVAMAEGDPGKSLLGVLVLQGMGKKGTRHSGNIRIIDRPGECVVEEAGDGIDHDGHFFQAFRRLLPAEVVIDMADCQDSLSETDLGVGMVVGQHEGGVLARMNGADAGCRAARLIRGRGTDAEGNFSEFIEDGGDN